VTTALRPQAPARATPEAAPAPRRVRTPRWLDLRLVLGVLLVLGSVLIGARVVSAADATVPVWSAATDLAAGTVLDADDLVAVDVRLADAGGAYLAASTRPEGRVLGRAVGSRELLPRAALEESSESVQLALPVQAGFVPPGLRRGQLVDVFAVADPAAGATGAADGSVRLVVGQAPVQAVSGASSGVLSTPTSTVQVVVAVPAASADEVLAAVGGRPLVVVVHQDGTGTGDGPVIGDPRPAAPGDPATSGAGAEDTGGTDADAGAAVEPAG
jgi:hypothetical protein